MIMIPYLKHLEIKNVNLGRVADNEYISAIFSIWNGGDLLTMKLY
jgi:hypothetical protein